MGFNKKRLPPLEELKAILENDPKRVETYLNADALIGPVDSANYLEEFVKKKANESTPIPEREFTY